MTTCHKKEKKIQDNANCILFLIIKDKAHTVNTGMRKKHEIKDYLIGYIKNTILDILKDLCSSLYEGL